MRPLNLSILAESFAVSRLEANSPCPKWADAGALASVTRSNEEVSIVCREDAVPADVRSERGWRAIRVEATLDFALTGILASLAVPLADARISIFALSTHDTDYVLVKEDALERAVAALTAAGHRFPQGTP